MAKSTLYRSFQFVNHHTHRRWAKLNRANRHPIQVQNSHSWHGLETFEPRMLLSDTPQPFVVNDAAEIALPLADSVEMRLAGNWRPFPPSSYTSDAADFIELSGQRYKTTSKDAQPRPCSPVRTWSIHCFVRTWMEPERIERHGVRRRAGISLYVTNFT